MAGSGGPGRESPPRLAPTSGWGWNASCIPSRPAGTRSLPALGSPAALPTVCLLGRTNKLSSGGRAESLDSPRNQHRGRRLLQRLVRRPTAIGLSLLDAADVLDALPVHTGCLGRRRIV